MHRCVALGGYTSARDAGDFNVMRYCLGLEYGRKGYNNSDKNTDWTCVIGVHTESTFVSPTGAAGFQIDPEEEGATFERAIFRDCTGRPNTEPGSTSNGAKFAVVKDVYLDGCQFVHTEDDCTTLRIAERIDRVRVKDTFLARDFFFESNRTPYPKQVRLERVQIGDGTQAPFASVGRGRCDVLAITDWPGGPGRLLAPGSHRSVRARIRAYGSSHHAFATREKIDCTTRTGGSGKLASSRLNFVQSSLRLRCRRLSQRRHARCTR
jgi:hypothetical protein